MKTFLKSNITLFFLIATAGLIVFFAFKNSSPVEAQSPTAYAVGGLTGSAWSNNIGEITFNTSSYDRVSVSPTTGLFNGYAWNDNIGWIKFGNLGTTPAVSGASTGQAKYNFGTGAVTGWARACSVFASGCSGSLRNNIYRGGWDGWISLASGAAQSQSGGGTGAVAHAQGNPTYGVNFNNPSGDGSGFAWGGTTEPNANFPGSGTGKDRKAAVIGWIDFTGVSLTVKPTVSLSANPSEFAYNTIDASVGADKPEQTTLTWSTNNATSCFDAFWTNNSIPGASGSWYGASVPLTGTQFTSFDLGPYSGPTPQKSKATFTLTCLGIGGAQKTASAVVQRGDELPIPVEAGPRKFEEF